MRTYETKRSRTFDTEYRENGPQADSLRDRLLSSPEIKGNKVLIPRGTVIIETSSSSLAPDFLDELSQEALEVDQSRSKLPVDIHRQKRGKLAMDTFMSMLDRHMSSDRVRGSQKDEPSLSWLYEGQHDSDGSYPPSAVLVHGVLDRDSMAELEAQLPEGIPLLDAKTNRLLNSIDTESEGRRSTKASRGMGGRAFRDYSHTEERGSVYSDASANPQRSYEGAFADLFPKRPLEDIDDGWQLREESEPDGWGTHPITGSSTPPQGYDANVQANLREKEWKQREADLLVDTAAVRKYGRVVADLSSREKTELYRWAAQTYHTDTGSDKADEEKFDAFRSKLR